MYAYRTPSRKPPRQRSKRCTREGDKFELSPTSQATCRKCMKKITKGSKRVGKEVYDDKYGWFHKYYHEQCSPFLEQKLNLPGGRSSQDEIAHQKKREVETQALIRERHELRERLRQLRMGFARRLNCADACYLIFDNKTLDDIVVKLPTNKSEMLSVWGIGEQKYQKFGDSIIWVVRQFKKESVSHYTSNATAIRQLDVSFNDAADDDTSDDIVVGEELTIDEIIRRKFEHAKQNNYVIDIDSPGQFV